MKYQIIIEKPARKYLNKQSKPQQERLLRAINRLPHAGDCKPLAGHSNLYRLRVGDCRVIYSVEHERITVYVLKIDNRGDVYRGL